MFELEKMLAGHLDLVDLFACVLKHKDVMLELEKLNSQQSGLNQSYQFLVFVRNFFLIFIRIVCYKIFGIR